MISDINFYYRFNVHCAVCGVIAAFPTYEEALEFQKEHEEKNNNLHLCVIIEG